MITQNSTFYKTFHSEWKSLINSGYCPTATDMAFFVLLTADRDTDTKLTADRIVQCRLALDKAFTPITNKNKLANGQTSQQALYQALTRLWNQTISLAQRLPCLENQQELLSVIADRAEKLRWQVKGRA